jgi:endonuclease-3
MAKPSAVQYQRLPVRERRRIVRIIDALERLYPDTRPGLHFVNPFQLLIKTILSAQTTDKQVNGVSDALFDRYPTPDALARADAKTLESIIKPVGYYRQKAKSAIETSRGLVERFNGVVPATIEELTTLRGVGRKTANVVLSHGFGVNEGVTVDTHVKRLSARLGLTAQSDPARIEMDLMVRIPQTIWNRFSHQLIDHGRAVCKARSPQCDPCVLNQDCPSAVKYRNTLHE